MAKSISDEEIQLRKRARRRLVGAIALVTVIAVFLPMVNRTDLSVSQDIFHTFAGRRHSGQIRLDITNFGNLLNHDWGVGKRIVNNQILTNGAADATGRLSYRMQLLNNNLITSPLQTTAGIADVYVMMLSFRYTFQ